MLQSPFQGGLHLHFHELPDSNVQVADGLGAVCGRGLGTRASRPRPYDACVRRRIPRRGRVILPFWVVLPRPPTPPAPALRLQQFPMLQSAFQRRLHLHVPELPDSNVQVADGLSPFRGCGLGTWARRPRPYKVCFCRRIACRGRVFLPRPGTPILYPSPVKGEGRIGPQPQLRKVQVGLMTAGPPSSGLLPSIWPVSLSCC